MTANEKRIPQGHRDAVEVKCVMCDVEQDFSTSLLSSARGLEYELSWAEPEPLRPGGSIS